MGWQLLTSLCNAHSRMTAAKIVRFLGGEQRTKFGVTLFRQHRVSDEAKSGKRHVDFYSIMTVEKSLKRECRIASALRHF